MAFFSSLSRYPGVGGFTVGQHGKGAVGAGLDFQLLVGQQRGHAILGHGREQPFAAAEGHLALYFPLKGLCKRGSNFIAEGVRHDYKNPILTGPHLLDIEIGLLGHLQDMAVLFQVFRAGIRPVLAQLAEEPMGVQPLYLVHHLLEQIIQQRMDSFRLRWKHRWNSR